MKIEIFDPFEFFAIFGIKSINPSVQLQCQIVEAQQLFLTLTEDALKIVEETEKAEKD